MKVIVVSDKAQQFNGNTYTRFGRYFRKRHTFIHRDVWEYHNGPILPEHHIHHKDNNGGNNQIENLEMINGREHLSRHFTGRKFVPVAAIAAHAVWCKTEEGQALYRKMGKLNAHYMHQEREFVCDQCQAVFRTEPRGNNRFCSNACKSKWRRAAGLDDVSRECAVCKREYRANKYSKIKTCSRKCSGVISANARRGVSQPKRKRAVFDCANSSS